MEDFINVLNSMNVAEIIAFILVAYFLIKQPLDKRIDDINKRFDDQNKRFDDLRDLFKSELESKIKPVEIALNNHISDTTKEIKALSDKLDKIISQSKK